MKYSLVILVFVVLSQSKPEDKKDELVNAVVSDFLKRDWISKSSTEVLFITYEDSLGS